MIRHYFPSVTPENLSSIEWAELLQEALWLNYFHLKQQADMLSSLLGGNN